MAYSVTTLSSAVQNGYTANKPSIIADNALRGTTTDAVWRTRDFSVHGANPCKWNLPASGNYDATSASFPTSYAFDDFADLQTIATFANYTPSPGTNDNACLLMEFAASTVDTLAIVNHNLGTLTDTYSTPSNPLYVEVFIADNKDFTSNRKRVFRWTDPPNNKPLIALNLSRRYDASPTGDYYEQYTSLQYVQIVVSCFSAAMTERPAIGEVFLGRRTQLQHQARVPYTDRKTSSNVEVSDPATGQASIYLNNAGARIFEDSYTLTTDLGDFVTFAKTYSDYGTRPFVYTPRPLSNWSIAGTSTGNYGSTFRDSFFVQLADPSVTIETSNRGPHDFDTTLSLLELPPYLSETT